MVDIAAYTEQDANGELTRHVFTHDTWGNTIHWFEGVTSGGWHAEILNGVAPEAQADPRKLRAPSTALGDVVLVSEVPAGTVPTPQP